MRILVCFKVVYDLEYITPQELLSLQNDSLDIAVFKKIIGSYDEAALETALCLAENAREQGETVALHALTVGECEKRFLENLFPLGFDDVFRIQLETSALPDHSRVAGSPEEDFSWQPELAADCIASFVKDSGAYDVIITGKQAGPGESGLVPRMLAHRLGLVSLPEVFSLEWSRRGIKVITKTDTGQAFMKVKKPAVFAVGEALHPYLRVPTLREKIAAGSREVQVLPAAGISPGPGAIQFLRYDYTMPQRDCRMIEGNSLSEKLETLWACLQRSGFP